MTKLEKIANRLADAYLRDRPKIARLCDEEIDRSGNLLGWLRDVADERKADAALSENGQ